MNEEAVEVWGIEQVVDCSTVAMTPLVVV